MPLSTSTASEKLRKILLLVATAVALSAGDEEDNVGAVVSTFWIVINELLSVNCAGISSEPDPEIVIVKVSSDSLTESVDAVKLNVFDVSPAAKVIVWLTAV